MRVRATPGPGGTCDLWWKRQPRDNGMKHSRSRNMCVDTNRGMVLGGRGSSRMGRWGFLSRDLTFNQRPKALSRDEK